MRMASITNRGGRENNEDYVKRARARELGCFVLCDGLGGHECGEVASFLAATEICRAFKENPRITEKAMREYIESAESLIEHERLMDPSKYNMSSTVTALITDGENAVWAHVGDSRIYRISDGEIVSVTRDHSIAYFEYENGMISYDDIRRSPNQNRLTRCLGAREIFIPDIASATDLKSGDAFLMCSDGFWEFVTERDITETLKTASMPKEWLGGMLKILHKNKTKYNDNYSAVAIMI